MSSPIRTSGTPVLRFLAVAVGPVTRRGRTQADTPVARRTVVRVEEWPLTPAIPYPIAAYDAERSTVMLR
ncbi:hypothetical protein ABT213_04795, partial [Streptomyces sp. NPDC001674]|uniref:hypothetical protein n=1 Tax=Streptomyces sp. NPDC001674 TaxID=3154394 RepID=UPI00331F2B08